MKQNQIIICQKILINIYIRVGEVHLGEDGIFIVVNLCFF